MSWQRYCTAFQYWVSAKLCDVEQRAPPIFGRVAITLATGPHSSLFVIFYFFRALIFEAEERPRGTFAGMFECGVILEHRSEGPYLYPLHSEGWKSANFAPQLGDGVTLNSCNFKTRLRFFASCISASRVQHISDMHSKFALGPHHVSKYRRHPFRDRWD